MKAIVYTATAAVAVAGLFAYGAGASPTGRPTATVVKFKATTASATMVDTPPLKVFGPGDGVVFRLRLSNPSTGKKLGTGTGTCQRYSAHDSKPEIDVCTDTFTLPGGQIIAMGTVIDEAPHSTLAIVGGTGSYRGARGEAVEMFVDDTSSLISLSFTTG